MKAQLRNIAAVAILAMVAGTTHAAVFSATANGPNGSHDTWNLAANWGGTVPSGTDSVEINSGLTAEVWYDGTPDDPAGGTQSYSGGLTLNSNSTLQIGWTNLHSSNKNALGTGPITMHDGSQIRLRQAETVTFNQAITVTGDTSIHVSPSTSAHHRTRNFDGGIGGSGSLTIIGNNNNTVEMNVANTFTGGLIANADDSWRIDADVAGSLGLGDVTINGDSSPTSRGATLRINADDVMDDFATLNLNGGFDHRLDSKLILNGDDTIGALFVDGADQGTGVFTSASGLLDFLDRDLITGTGSLTVTGITERPSANAVPEPASIAIWSLLGLALAGYGYRRRRNS